MMLTDLADVLRAAGLPVVEEPGWKTRGHGQMVDVRTITCHHTGGTKDLRVIVEGRPGLAGPLAQCWLARDGVWHVVAAGLCWHAGVSRSSDYTNSHALGIEAEATGVDPWPPVQYGSYVRGAAALRAHYGVPLDHVLGHKETCAPVGRKTDPNFDMNAFRAAVAKAQTTPQEDDMPYSEDQVRELAGQGVLGAPIGREKVAGDKPLTVGIVLSRLYASAQVDQAQNAALAEALKSLAANVAKGIDGDALIAAVRADVQASLKDVTITLSTGA